MLEIGTSGSMSGEGKRAGGSLDRYRASPRLYQIGERRRDSLPIIYQYDTGFFGSRKGKWVGAKRTQ